MSHVTHESAMSHVNGSCHIYIIHFPCEERAPRRRSHVYVCARGCVCERETERPQEMERESVCVRVYGCVCVCERERESIDIRSGLRERESEERESAHSPPLSHTLRHRFWKMYV